MELADCMVSLGFKVNREELIELIQKNDIDGDGCMQFDEFLTSYLKKYTDRYTERDLKQVFFLFTGDKKNLFINEMELRQVAEEVGFGDIDKEAIAMMIRFADLDMDNQVGLQDFVTFMQKGIDMKIVKATRLSDEEQEKIKKENYQR